MNVYESHEKRVESYRYVSIDISVTCLLNLMKRELKARRRGLSFAQVRRANLMKRELKVGALRARHGDGLQGIS